MQVIILTRDDSLFESAKNTFEKDADFVCVRLSDELALLKFLRRNDAGLVLIDSDPTFSPHSTFLTWRNCYRQHSLPVLVIGRFFELDSMIRAFEAGADDIVIGPPSIDEIHARALHLIERFKLGESTTMRIKLGRYTLDKVSGTVIHDNLTVRLTAREFAIAWLFFSHPGVFLSRTQIAHTIWGKDLDIVGRTLEQHIYKLRRKLSLSETSGVRMTTVYSLGYQLEMFDIPVHDVAPQEGSGREMAQFA